MHFNMKFMFSKNIVNRKKNDIVFKIKFTR